MRKQKADQEPTTKTLKPKSPTLLNIELLNYYPKPKYLIIGSFGPLGKAPKPKADLKGPKP